MKEIDKSKIEYGLIDDLIDVFYDTHKPQLSGLCNITFLTFLKANFSEQYIKEKFPVIYDIYEDEILE